MALMSEAGLLFWDGCARSRAEIRETPGQPPSSKQAPLSSVGQPLPSNGPSCFVCGRKSNLERAIRSIFNGALKPCS